MTADSDVVTPADLKLTVDDLVGAFHSRFIHVSRTSGRCHFTRCAAVRMNDSGTAVIRRVTVVDSVGTGSTDDEAGQVCYLYNWQTGDPRRGGKARSYVPGVTDDSLDDEARLDGGVLTAGTSDAEDYIADVVGISHGDLEITDFIEMSFRDSNDYRLAAVFYPITDGALNDIVATQRRRVDRLRG
jgi:hypothetical protein